MHGEQPADLDLLRHLPELDLHAFAVTELDAKALTFCNVSLRNLHAAFGEAQPAHAVRQACRPKPDLRDLEFIALVQQDVFGRNFESVELELAMTAMLMRSHDRDTAQNAPAGLILVEQERSQTTPFVVAGASNQDEMRRRRRHRSRTICAL